MAVVREIRYTQNELIDPIQFEKFIEVDELTKSSEIDQLRSGKWRVTTRLKYEDGSYSFFSPVKEITIIGANLNPPVNIQPTDVYSSQVSCVWNLNENADNVIIEKSLNGVDYSSFITQDASITTFSDFNLSSGTTYYYRLKYTGDGYTDSEYSYVDITTNSSIVLFEDDFDGTYLDEDIYSVLNRQPLSVQISQNNSLIIQSTGVGNAPLNDNRVSVKDNWSLNEFTISGIINVSPGTDFTQLQFCFREIDISTANIVKQAAFLVHNLTGNIRLSAFDNINSVSYSVMNTGVPLNNTRLKITKNNNIIDFKYWDTISSEWVNIGNTTINFDNLNVVMTIQAVDTYSRTVTFNELRITDKDYTSEMP